MLLQMVTLLLLHGLYPETKAYLWEKTQKLPVFGLGLIASCFTCPAKR